MTQPQQTMESIDDLFTVENMQEMWKQVPKEMKDHLPNGGAAISTILLGFSKYSSYHPIEKLHEVTSEFEKVDRSTATNLVTKAAKHVPTITDNNKETILTVAQTGNQRFKPDSELVQSLEKQLAKKANAALGYSLFSSFITLLNETIKIYKIWEDICDAQILFKTSFYQKKAIIQANIDRIPVLIAKFAEGIQPSCYEDLDDRKVLRFHIRKTRERDEIRKVLDRVEKDIDNLEVEVNGKMKRMSEICEVAPLAAGAQIVQAGGVALNVVLFAGGANVWLTLANIMACSGHLVAAFKHVDLAEDAKACHVALGEKLLEIKMLRDITFQQQLNLDAIFNEFNDDMENEH